MGWWWLVLSIMNCLLTVLALLYCSFERGFNAVRRVASWSILSTACQFYFALVLFLHLSRVLHVSVPAHLARLWHSAPQHCGQGNRWAVCCRELSPRGGRRSLRTQLRFRCHLPGASLHPLVHSSLRAA